MQWNSTKLRTNRAGLFTLVSRVAMLCLVGTTSVYAAAFAAPQIEASRIAIILPEDADDVELRVANVLQERILKRSDVSVEITRGETKKADLCIYLGRLRREGTLDKLCTATGVKLPGKQRPAPEGFTAKRVQIAGTPSVLAVGADNRGTLYAVGEILRQLTLNPRSVSLDEFDVSTAPAYRYRGFSANQGGTMMSVTKARAWSQEEWQHYVLEMALAGANCFYASGAGFDFVKSFDLMAVTGSRPNEMHGKFPREWRG